MRTIGRLLALALLGLVIAPARDGRPADDQGGIGTAGGVAAGSPASARAGRQLAQPVAPPPLLVENRGQFQDAARFRTLFPAPAVAVTGDGIVLTQLARGADGSITSGHNVRIGFGSTDPEAGAPWLAAAEPAKTRASYFRGNDPDRWQAAVPCWKSVAYEHVVAGVDVEVHFRRGTLEYDVIAGPGARLDDLAVTIDGADDVSIDEDGRLEFRTPLGVVTQAPPVVWQTGRDERRKDLACAVVLSGPNRLGFRVPDWDGRSRLTIDPTILLSTFVEGSESDGASAPLPPTRRARPTLRARRPVRTSPSRPVPSTSR